MARLNDEPFQVTVAVALATQAVYAPGLPISCWLVIVRLWPSNPIASRPQTVPIEPSDWRIISRTRTSGPFLGFTVTSS